MLQSLLLKSFISLCRSSPLQQIVKEGERGKEAKLETLKSTRVLGLKGAVPGQSINSIKGHSLPLDSPDGCRSLMFSGKEQLLIILHNNILHILQYLTAFVALKFFTPNLTKTCKRWRAGLKQ